MEMDLRSRLGLAATLTFLVAAPFVFGMPLYIVILSMLAIVFLHELGHYVTAKATGMKATDFFVGLGPTIWSVKRGDTDFGLKAIPLGAFVRIIGMTSNEVVSPQDEDSTYRSKPYRQKLLVACAGSAVHFIVAIALIFAFSLAVGQVTEEPSEEWTIDRIYAGSPAADAGIQPGDTILGVDGTEAATMQDVVELLPATPQEVTLTVGRGEQQIETILVLAQHPAEQDRTWVGVASSTATIQTSSGIGFFDAVGRTGEVFATTTKESVVGIGKFFTPSNLSNFVGGVFGVENGPASPESATDGSAVVGGVSPQSDAPDESRATSVVGIAQIGIDIVEDDYWVYVLFLAIINVFFGVFNLVPLLPFDGGHVAIATYERIRSRRGRRYTADTRKMMPVTFAVVSVLVLLFMGAMYQDIADPIQLPN